MIEVRTFLKRGKAFVDPEEFSGQIEDTSYIEGAIELSIDHRPLLSREEWDYVDELWAYLLQGLFQIHAGEDFSTYLPDQPIQVSFHPEAEGQRVRVQVQYEGKNVEARADLSSFVHVMAREARRFFERMQLLVPFYEHELDELLRLDSMLSESLRSRRMTRGGP